MCSRCIVLLLGIDSAYALCPGEIEPLSSGKDFANSVLQGDLDVVSV